MLPHEVNLFWRLFIDGLEFRVDYSFSMGWIKDPNHKISVSGDTLFESGAGTKYPFVVNFEINGRKCLVHVYREIQYFTADLYCDDELMNEGKMNFIPFPDQPVK